VKGKHIVQQGSILLVSLAFGYGIQWVFTAGAGPWQHQNAVLFMLLVHIIGYVAMDAPGGALTGATRTLGHPLIRIPLGLLLFAVGVLAFGLGMGTMLPIEPRDVNHAITLGYYEYFAWVCVIYLYADRLLYRRFRVVREKTVVLLRGRAYWPGERLTISPFITGGNLTAVWHPFPVEIEQLMLVCKDGIYNVSVEAEILLDFRKARSGEPQIAGTAMEVYQGAQQCISRKLQHAAQSRTIGHVAKSQHGPVYFDAAGVPLIWEGRAEITLCANK
jgi:hypothetical protein